MLVDASSDQLMIPNGIANDGKVVLNLSPGAILNLDMALDYIAFSARFNGVSEDIYCPMSSVLALYARENGEGMMFPEEEPLAKEAEAGKPAAPSGPTLKVIK